MEKKIVGLNTYFKSLEYENFDEYEFSARISLLILDFTGFAKEEMRPFAFGTIEYDDAHYSDQGHIAHIREQGICIMKKQALEMLMQL